MVLTIAVAGVIATLVVDATGRLPTTVANTKLQSEVNLLNEMMGLYLADGGSVDGLTTPQMVIDALKTGRAMESMQTYTGVASGKLVDVRLRARCSSGALRRGAIGRAIWDPGARRFHISADGRYGADEFYLDESLASANFGTAKRDALAMSFNKSNGWAWGSVAPATSAASRAPEYVAPAGADTYFNPVELASASSGSGSGGSVGGSSGGGSSSQSNGSASPQLPSPVFSPHGGSFAYNSFPSQIAIADNGAPSGQSKIVYQVNHGPWQDYTSGIAVQSGDVISAQNVTLNPAVYASSGTTTEEFYRLVAGIDGSESAAWTNVTGGSNLLQNLTTDGATVTLTHGETKLNLGGGVVFDAGTPNSISFTQTAFSGITPDTWFKLGDVAALNGTTFYDSEASGVTLRLAFQLSEPSVAAAAVDVPLAFINNENTSDPLASADAVEIKTPSTGTVFTSGGVNYHLELEWLNLDPSAAAIQGTQLLVFEGSTAQVELRARFVADH